MRILLFLLTNLAIMVVAGIVLSVLGVGSYMTSNGLNLTSLLIFCAVFGFVGSFISLFLSKFMAKKGSGAVVIEQPRNHKEVWLLDTVKELADKSNIGMPEVAIFPSHDANAFATGWNKNAALVAVSSGMLERFSPDEIKAVLAHEVGHIANGDMITLSLIQGVVNTFVMFFARIAAYAVDQFLRRGDDNNQSVGFGYYIATFVFEMLFGVLASMIVMWFSRYREFRADEAGARLAGKHAMISALARLQQEHEQTHMPDSMLAFGIRRGKTPSLGELFSSHPPIEDRIKALQAL
ncbi:protease HtpX [Marinomonas sp. C2222]|uniref:Protease HtpX n=1 Tax=Marinomonas sargassi TaxID=2984494 RepID=A0ABT2YSJ3_9GAMM|nr:protease HtpX [Marinomonas sargassi]MCV2402867.1 protease HtpX [Marinomonas sargassi]